MSSPSNQASRSKQRRSGRGRRDPGKLAIETLESRAMMAAFVGEGAGSVVSTISWRDQMVPVIQDSYVVRMPRLATVTAETVDNYSSDSPTVPAGWMTQSLGLGYFQIDTNGSGWGDVLSWSQQIGAAEFSPNFVSELQSLNVPNDPYYSRGQLWGLTKVKAEAAWNLNAGSSDLIAAVMDEGIDWNHEDLSANMWSRTAANARLPAAKKIPNSLTGLYGYDDADNDPDVMPQDPDRIPAIKPAAPNNLSQVHGTHVAGILGAVPNSTGVVGVAQQVKLYSAKVVSDAGYRFGTWGNFCRAINRIVQLKTQHEQNFVVVNASFRFPVAGWWEAGCIADLANANILFVAAAGNQGYTTWADSGSNLIVVGASDRSDNPCLYSNAGDIYAPGDDIFSTASGYKRDGSSVPADNRNDLSSDEYLSFKATDRRDLDGTIDSGVTPWRGWLEGTSMAAPFVSGAAIIVATEYRKYTKRLPSPAYIKQAILAGADSVNGILRLNIEKSCLWVRENLPPSITLDPGKMIERDSDADEMTLRLRITKYDNALQKNFPAGASAPLTVRYRLESVSATLGTDFDYWDSGRKTFTIPAGTDTVIFTTQPIPTKAGTVRLDPLVRVFGDTDREQNELFTVVLESVTGGSEWIGSDTVFCTILNDDPDALNPAVTMASPTQQVRETSVTPGAVAYFANVNIDAGLGQPSLRPVTFRYTVAEMPRNPDGTRPADAAKSGQDFLATTGLVTVPAGQTTARIPFRILNDQARETDERFRIMLSVKDEFGLLVPDAGYPRLGVLKNEKLETVVTIRDASFSTPGDPNPGVVPALSIVGPPVITERTGQNTRYSFVASLQFPISVPVTFTYSLVGGDLINSSNPKASAGADFIAAPNGMVTLRPGQTSAQIFFTVVGDAWGLKRGDIPDFVWDAPTECLSLIVSRGSLTNATLKDPVNTFVASIQDDDVSAVTITGPSALVAAGALATFTFGTADSLGKPYAVPVGYRVKVDYAVVNGTAKLGTDFTGPPKGSIFIPAGSSSGTINVRTISQTVAVDKSFSVRITGLSLVPNEGKPRIRLPPSLVILGNTFAMATIKKT